MFILPPVFYLVSISSISLFSLSFLSLFSLSLSFLFLSLIFIQSHPNTLFLRYFLHCCGLFWSRLTQSTVSNNPHFYPQNHPPYQNCSLTILAISHLYSVMTYPHAFTITLKHTKVLLLLPLPFLLHIYLYSLKNYVVHCMYM